MCKNAVRFGFWGAEEEGLLGSTKYVESLDVEALKDIALYLNFDMLGSPNPGYFTYDGDQSAPPHANGVPRVPEGSAGIERTLAAYLDGAGKNRADTGFDGRSDYDGFTQAGIPAGGLFSGAEDKMSDDEAKLWGGEADAAVRPELPQERPTPSSTSTAPRSRSRARASPTPIGLYAQDQRGRNGVPGPRRPHPARGAGVMRAGAGRGTGLPAGGRAARRAPPHPAPARPRRASWRAR